MTTPVGPHPPQDLNATLETLLATWENEVIEAKAGGAGFSTDEIGKYFSALANEAALRSTPRAWLLFGIDNRTRRVIGTDYRPDPGRLHSLKHQISQSTSTHSTFRTIHELQHTGGRVLLFEIPAAPDGQPTAWKGHYYARNGESLGPLSLDKLDALRSTAPCSDWSAQPVSSATVDDLDPEAVSAARTGFAARHDRIPNSDVFAWPTLTFLDRAGLLADGEISAAALLLLGTSSGARKIPGFVLPEISWILETEDRAYEHFSPPFLLATSCAFDRIRNFRVRMTQPGTLIQTEVARYDRDVVLEAIHNCVAHADWGSGSRINLLEFADRIQLTNAGSFIEGRSVEDYVLRGAVPKRYRNPLLAQAMVHLNMIDRVGYGLKSMHLGQQRRYLPLPDYDLSDPERVVTTIYGRVIDANYSEQLMAHADLELADVLALDRVQKKLPINTDTRARLRRLRLIEGRAPNVHVSAAIAAATGTEADYLRARATENAHYAELVRSLLREFGPATRKQIDAALAPHLPTELDETQRRKKVSNVLTRLRSEGVIRNAGTQQKPSWILTTTPPSGHSSETS